MFRSKIGLILVGLFLVILSPLNLLAEPHGKLIVFHAGSLTIPFKRIARQFEMLYPQVEVLQESGGSTRMARLIADVGKPADVMAAADYQVIDNILRPKFANYNIRFASNQLVLCYTPRSRYADEITKDNWYKILCRKGVVWGHSDPNLDPCGYRSLMVMQLAEKFYKKPGLYKRLLANRPIKNIRPKSVELISLLQTGNMDYAWEYLSVAVQHHLRYVKLDDHINLGNYKYDPYYRQAKVKVVGKRPGKWIIKRGKSCTYGITILKNAHNPEAAIAFVAYLLSPAGGLKILKEMGQPPFIPARVPTKKMWERLPRQLKPLVEIKN